MKVKEKGFDLKAVELCLSKHHSEKYFQVPDKDKIDIEP